jgi:adenosylmethionine---8-amino-7-oxononanoate aminotransferase
MARRINHHRNSESRRARPRVAPRTAARRVEELAEWDRRFLWHPFTQMLEWEQEPPLIIERGRGPYLIDLDGRRYLDGVSSIWVNLHGHRHPALDRAVRRQLAKIAHSTMLGLSNPPAIELARELIRLAPKGLSRVFYSDNGSTAVEVALKMAIQYWQQRRPAVGSKQTFVHLQYAYHGDTIGAMSVGGVELFHGPFRPLLFRSLAAEAPYCYRCPLDLRYPSCAMRCIESVEALLKRRRTDIAALIIEPLVQAAGGMVVAPPGYLAKIRELCTRYEVLLIADEVATGFGRTGRMFACEHENVSPDLMALSKGLTGGYLPLAATLTTEEVYRAFLGTYRDWKTFFHGHSYTGNPLACAVALANLSVFRTERTLTRLQGSIRLLRDSLTCFEALKHVGDIRQCGYMIGLELVQDKPGRIPYPLEARMGHRVAMEARRRDLILRPLGNVIVLMPPLSTPHRELRRMVRIVAEAIQAVTDAAAV